MQIFDVIIIGSGQGGVPLAKKLAKAGKKTLIVEKRLVGGTCINDGCTPTKAMIASAKRAYSIAHSDELGIESGSCRVDFPKVIERKNKIVASFHDSAQKGLETTENLTLLFGEAYFTADKTIAVRSGPESQETYTASQIFINTGAASLLPPIPGLNKVPYLTSTTLLDIDLIPEHLLILGGSYIALEFGQMFRRFGSKVTIIDQSPAFLSHEDDDIAECLKNILLEEEITILLEAHAESIQAQEDGKLQLRINVNGESKTVTGSHLLVATGRKPQSEALQLGKIGVKTDDHGHILVNEFLETSAEGIFALGDVKGGPAFTHISYNDYLVLLNNVLNKPTRSITGRFVPYTMFTDPQLGRVGLSEKEARAKGINYQVTTLQMDKAARGIETGETKGMMKALVDPDTKQILGAAILAVEGGEVMSMLQLAMAGKIPYDEIREMIFAHPLFAESLNNLFMPLDK